MEHPVIRVYTNVVPNNVMLQLRHDFYNTVFKMKHKIYVYTEG